MRGASTHDVGTPGQLSRDGNSSGGCVWAQGGKEVAGHHQNEKLGELAQRRVRMHGRLEPGERQLVWTVAPDIDNGHRDHTTNTNQKN